MYEIIRSLHSGWAYVALLLLIVAVINSLIGLFSKKDYLEKDKKIGLFAVSAVHMQLVFGFIIYFVSPAGFMNILNLGMGEVMKNAALRLTVIEHPFINILAIVVMTIGWVKHKKQTDKFVKFKTVAVYFALTLLLILSRIPWKMWF
jgi:hypothetical protein